MQPQYLLPQLWADLTPRYPNAGLEEFTDSIVALERFGEIRFPENLAQRGGMMSAGFGELPPRPQPGDRDFTLDARAIDKLIAKLFEISNLNPPSFNYLLKNQHAEPYYVLHNEHSLMRQHYSAPTTLNLMNRAIAAAVPISVTASSI